MMDRTIPRHPHENSTANASWGRFIDRGDHLVLEDRRGNTWRAGPGWMPRYLAGGNQNTIEGFHRAPRPWVFDPQGNVVVEGDFVEILFVDKDQRIPYVRPGVAPLNRDDAGFFPVNPIGEDPNPLRGRWAARDPRTGNVTGTLEVTALDGGNGFEIVVGGGAFGTGTRIELDHDAGTVKIGQGSETHQVAFGEAIVQAIKTLAEGLLQLDTVVAAKLISSAPILTATVTPVITDCATSLSAGAPMLSNIVKVE